MTDYIDKTDLRAYMKTAATGADTNMDAVITVASRAVDSYCGRFFYPSTSTVRYFSANPRDPQCLWILPIHDLSTTTSLTVVSETGNDGTYPTTWAIDVDFIAEPVNREQSGITGWPYTHLRAIGGKVWPIKFLEWQRETVKITGTFGWTAIPDPVKQATRIIAAQLWKLGEAPFGVAGWGAYGDIKVREIPQAATLLAPYRRMRSAVGVA